MTTAHATSNLARIGSIPAKIGRLRYGRQMMHYGKRLGIPRLILNRLIRLVKLVLHPNEFVQRKRLARKLLRDGPPKVRVPKNKGFAPFSEHDFPGVARVIETCRAVHARAKAGDLDLKVRKKHIITLFSAEFLIEHSEIIKFATSRPVLKTVTDYLGTVPCLTAVNLWWGRANESIESSQLFHIDQEDTRQLKLYVLIYDVTEENGPLHLIPAEVSDRVFPNLSGPYRRTTDEEMLLYCRRDEIVQCTGRAGEGFLVDTCRCFHYGSRTRAGERLVLMLQYLPFHCLLETADLTLVEALARRSELRASTDAYVAKLLSPPPNPFSPAANP